MSSRAEVAHELGSTGAATGATRDNGRALEPSVRD